MSALMFLAATVALGCVLVCSMPAPRKPVDWRDEWCCLECRAPDGQEKPCDDCPVRG